MSLEKVKSLIEAGARGTDRVNERGNKVSDCFAGSLDRYYFDSKLCAPSGGFEQFDTQQDASYFGVWVSREEMAIVTYAEGDLSLVACASADSFKAEIKSMEEFYGEAPPMATAIGHDGSVTKYYDDRISAKSM